MMDLPKKKITQSALDPRYAKEVAKIQAKGKAHKKAMKANRAPNYTSNKTRDGQTEMDILKKSIPSAFSK